MSGGSENHSVEDHPLHRGGRILVTRLQYLGDVILTLPMVRALKEKYPDVEIDYLAKRPGAEMLGGEDMFGKVFTLPESGIIPTLKLIRTLRKRRYAIAIDLLCNPRSAVLTFLSGAALRIGSTKRIRKYMYSIRVEVPSDVRSACAHHLYHLRPLGIIADEARPRLSLSDEEKKRAARYLDGLAPGARKSSGVRLRVALHPGGKWEVKRWPVENFAELCRRLIEGTGADIYILSAPGEEVFSKNLSSLLQGEAFLIPVKPVRETASIISQMDCYIGGDGGMTHVAVALGVPTVCIFGSSEWDIWFPYEKYGPFAPAAEEVDCRPCHTHTCSHLSCLRKLSVDKVCKETMNVIKRCEDKSAPRMTADSD